MYKSILKAFCLLCISMSASYAQMTSIFSAGLYPVQCNKWGWVQGNAQTSWDSGCTPLEIRGTDNKIYSVATTEGLCDANESAVFYYRVGGTQIDFIGCRTISSN